MPTCNKCSVFEEKEDVEEKTAGKRVAYCEACGRDLKRDAPLYEERSIGISHASRE